MDKDDKITFQDLADWLDKPLSNNDIDLINFIVTSIENRYKHLELQQKVNQLETNWNELKEWLISNDVYYPEAILFRETLHKMRELEGGSNENSK